MEQHAFQQLLERIAGNDPTLVSIDLNGKLSKETAGAFAEALSTNTSLRRLDLRANDLGHNGVKAVGKALANNEHLERADLRENGVITSRTGMNVFFSLGKRHRCMLLGLLSFNSIMQDAIYRCTKQYNLRKEEAIAIARSDPVTREGLRAICEDLESPHNMVPEFSRHEELASRTAMRINLLKYMAQHPEQEETPLKNPVVILGLWRTGTTKLFNLMSRATGARSPLLWEIWFPTPPPTKESYKDDARIKQASKRCEHMFTSGIMRRDIHDAEPEFPEECMFVMREAHFYLEYLFNQTYPTYLDWLERFGMEEAYKYCRKFYQVIGSKYQPESHWLLKAPLHLTYLDLMLHEYGRDTKMIFCHRDPVQAVASALSLYLGISKAEWTNVDVNKTSRWFLDYCAKAWAIGMDRLDRLEREGRGAQIVHVYYKELMKDPIKCVEDVSAVLGLPEVDPKPLQDWIDANPKGKHGAHKYALADFGLTVHDVHAAFAPYYARFYPDKNLSASRL